LGPDLEAVASKGEPMSDHILGDLAVALRLGRRPGPLQLLLGLVGRVREGGHEDQPAHRPGHPAHNPCPGVMRKAAPWRDLWLGDWNHSASPFKKVRPGPAVRLRPTFDGRTPPDQPE